MPAQGFCSARVTKASDYNGIPAGAGTFHGARQLAVQQRVFLYGDDGMRVVCLFVFAFSFLLTGFASDAMAAPGYASNELKVRAGPDSDYPVITRVADNRLLDIRGCTDGWKWCEVSTHGARGWVPADQLRIVYQGKRVQLKNYGERLRVPVVGYDRKDYWQRNYRDRDFYRSGSQWDRRHDNGYHRGHYKNDKAYYYGRDGVESWNYTDKYRVHDSYRDYKQNKYGYNR